MADGIQQIFYEIPPITRIWVCGSVLLTAACFLEFVNPFSLYLSMKLISKGQVWRLITPFLFFGDRFNIEFFFQMFFLMRYCRSLEESSFRNRTADFFWFVLLAACTMLLVAPFLRFNFLGSSLNYAMVYLWARRNPYARMNMLGIFDFNAPYLPYVLLGFSVLMGANGASDILGIAVGHIYYFLEDIYPLMLPSRTRLLKTPGFVRALFGAPADRPFVVVADPVNAAAVVDDSDSDDDIDGDEHDMDEQQQPRDGLRQRNNAPRDVNQ